MPPAKSEKLEKFRSRTQSITSNDGSVSGDVKLKSSGSSGSLYKTELCRSYEDTGMCRYGKKCQFAHSRKELRSLTRHPKYKTDMCKSYHTSGFCPYGSRCHFIHEIPNDDKDDKQTRSLRISDSVDWPSKPVKKSGLTKSTTLASFNSVGSVKSVPSIPSMESIWSTSNSQTTAELNNTGSVWGEFEHGLTFASSIPSDRDSVTPPDIIKGIDMLRIDEDDPYDDPYDGNRLSVFQKINRK